MCISCVCIFICLHTYNHCFVVAQVLYALPECLFVSVCLEVCAHTVILNNWLNSCGFISLSVCIYVTVYISPCCMVL